MLKSERLGLVLAAATVLNVVVVAILYMLYPGYLDHGEGTISAMAWRLLDGLPAYHSFADADRITNLYGPITYLWYAWPLALFGGSVTTSKIAAALACIGGTALMVRQCLTAPAKHAPWLAMFVAAMIAWYLPFPATIRPDGILTLLVSVAVLTAAWGDARKDLAAAAIIGVSTGLAMGLKLHGAIYIAPAALYYGLADWRRIPVMALVAAFVAALPFASPLFPLDAYLEWFGPMAGKEVSIIGVRRIWQHGALTLALPVGLWWGVRRLGVDKRLVWYLAAFLALAALAAFPAAKTGGGPHYFYPFLPVVVDLARRMLNAAPDSGKRLVIVVAVSAAVVSFQNERRFFKKQEWDKSASVVAEINSILTDYADLRIQMGVGRTAEDIGDQFSYHYYVWRNLPVYRGHPYTIDAGNMMEMTKLGVAFPDSALQRFKDCHTQLWIIPKNGDPFSLYGYYKENVFPDELLAVFKQKYRRIETREHFDLWKCAE